MTPVTTPQSAFGRPDFRDELGPLQGLLANRVAEHGWTCVGLYPPAPGEPCPGGAVGAGSPDGGPFETGLVYTLGLHFSYGSAELAVTGLPPTLAMSDVLHPLCEAVGFGHLAPEVGGVFPGVATYGVRFGVVHPAWVKQFGPGACGFYSPEEMPAFLQVLYADRHGVFPFTGQPCAVQALQVDLSQPPS